MPPTFPIIRRRTFWQFSGLELEIVNVAAEPILRALTRSALSFLQTYARTKGGHFHEEADCAWFTTTIPFPVFNGVAAPCFAVPVAPRAFEVYKQLKELPHSWFVTPYDERDNLANILEGLGPAHVVDLNGMAAPLSDLAPAPLLPSGVEMVPANDDQVVSDYVKLFARLFGAPIEGWIDPLVEAELQIFRSADDPFHRYVAMEDGEPIAAGMTTSESGFATLQTLYTLPDRRGRGIGHAILARAFEDEMADGAHTGLIWSGPDADKLYARAGFDYVTTAQVFIFDPVSNG